MQKSSESGLCRWKVVCSFYMNAGVFHDKASNSILPLISAIHREPIQKWSNLNWKTCPAWKENSNQNLRHVLSITTEVHARDQRFWTCMKANRSERLWANHWWRNVWSSHKNAEVMLMVLCSQAIQIPCINKWIYKDGKKMLRATAIYAESNYDLIK